MNTQHQQLPTTLFLQKHINIVTDGHTYRLTAVEGCLYFTHHCDKWNGVVAVVYDEWTYFVSSVQTVSVVLMW